MLGGITDKLKKATGLGLTPEEKYSRAFDNGVLLKQYQTASELFDSARQDAEKKGAPALAKRCRANALLYSFIEHGRAADLQQLATALKEIEQIEVPGSKTEFLDAGKLAREADARIAHLNVASVQGLGDRMQAHHVAAAAFHALSGERLVLHPYHFDRADLDTPEKLFFHHSGEAIRIQSEGVWLESPDRCVELLARSISHFQQAGEEALARQLTAQRDLLRRRQTCFLTNLRLQGEDFHYRRYVTSLSPYFAAQAKEQGRDEASIDLTKSEVVLSVAAASVIETIADRIAAQRVELLRLQLSAQIHTLAAAVTAIQERLNK